MEESKNQSGVKKLKYEAPELIKYGKFSELTAGAGSLSDMGTFGSMNETEPT